MISMDDIYMIYISYNITVQRFRVSMTLFVLRNAYFIQERPIQLIKSDSKSVYQSDL